MSNHTESRTHQISSGDHPTTLACYIHIYTRRLTVQWQTVHIFTTQCYADCGTAMASHPSVLTLKYCDHICWNTLKIISWLISLRSSLSTDPNVMDLFQREHPIFFHSSRTNVPNVAKRSIWHQCKKYILTTDPTTSHLGKLKWPYLRKGSSDPLHVWFYGGVFGVGGSNSAISSWTKFNRYVEENNARGVIRLVTMTQSKVFFCAGISGCEKIGSRCRKHAISLKWLKIEWKLLLTA